MGINNRYGTNQYYQTKRNFGYQKVVAKQAPSIPIKTIQRVASIEQDSPNIWKENVMLSNSLRADIVKLQKVLEIEREITSKMKLPMESSIKFADEQAKHLNAIMNETNEYAKRKELLEFKKQFDRNVKHITKWPPEEVAYKTAAHKIVSEFTKNEFKQRVSSAMKSDFVESEEDFLERTVARALETNAITKNNRVAFIKEINNHLKEAYKSLDMSDKYVSINGRHIKRARWVDRNVIMKRYNERNK